MSLIRRRWSISGEHSLRSVVNAVSYLVRMNSRACLCYKRKKFLSRDRRVFSFNFFFFAAAHFHFALVAARISHFLPATTEFSCSFSNMKIFLLCFLSLALDLFCPFSRWASLACRLLSPFLCLSQALYSKFVDMTTQIQKKFPLSVFVVIDIFRCLCFTRRGWLCHFPPK